MALEGRSAGLPTASPHSRFDPPTRGALLPQDEPLIANLQRPRRPGGSTMGRLMRRSRTRTAGIRFEWAMRSCGPVLRVVATWTDRLGQPHHTSYSVQCNGLEGALDRAIASRISCGAPMPDREDLLQRLRQEFATAPHLANAQAAGQAAGAAAAQARAA
ncbi:hypothetical protein [Roseateles sp. LYH14W]|uniref:TSCPD domain-containing protein n=1 Tax=Pelomonas parva TaxID=3299032 RepID=A0ABW7F6D9_9BURK